MTRDGVNGNGTTFVAYVRQFNRQSEHGDIVEPIADL
jgi:hypothetical protein